MENSKIILVTLIVLTLLVGGISGYLIAGNNQPLQRQDDFKKLMMLKAMSEKKDNGPRQDHQRDRDLQDKKAQMHNLDRMQNKHMNKEQMAHKKGEMFLKIMTKKCNLTDAQQSQVKDVLESSKDELTVAKDEFKGRLNVIKDKTDAQIENILTDEQKAEYKELKESAKQSRMQQSKLQNKTFKRLAQKKRTLNKVRASAF